MRDERVGCLRGRDEPSGRAVREALDRAGLPAADEVSWEIPRELEPRRLRHERRHALARQAQQPPRQDRRGDRPTSRRPRLWSAWRWRGRASSTCSCPPAGARVALRRSSPPGRPTVPARPRAAAGICSSSSPPTRPGRSSSSNARAAAVGDALARILRAQGAEVETSTTSMTPASSSRRSPRPWRRGSGRPSGSRPSCRTARTPGSTWWTSPGAISPRTRPAPALTLARPPGERLERLGRLRGGAHGGRAAARPRRVRHALRPVVPRGRRCAEARAWRSGPSMRSPRRGHTFEQDGALWFRRPRSATTRTGSCASPTAS